MPEIEKEASTATQIQWHLLEGERAHVFLLGRLSRLCAGQCMHTLTCRQIREMESCGWILLMFELINQWKQSWMDLRGAALLPQTLFLPVRPGVYMCADFAPTFPWEISLFEKQLLAFLLKFQHSKHPEGKEKVSLKTPLHSLVLCPENKLSSSSLL